MGLATSGNRLALGTRKQIWDFRDVPSAAAMLEPAGRVDGCFVPRCCHFTGNVLVHEMGWVGEELWFVNTRFSCVCTLDGEHSFVPRWRPPFIGDLKPEDRCHLNGLGLQSGRPSFATALGATDTPVGWRVDKAKGGVLIDIRAGATIARGLSMPHSPRWHAGRLWLLESGTGTLGVVDLDSGRYDPIAALPGFTRGLDFLGPLAFVGLSKARETAVFGGLAITERPEELICGVCAIDIRSGKVVAYLKFEDGVREIFAVAVLRDRCYPDVIAEDEKLLADSFVIDDGALADVPCQIEVPAAPD
jgi:uncharacterized protein (TIGR03032 family)